MSEAVKDAKADLLDLIETAIDDSMDIDWTSRVGAEHVYRAMEREGLIQRLEAFPATPEATLRNICEAHGLRAISIALQADHEDVTLYLHPRDEGIEPCFGGRGESFDEALEDGLEQIREAIALVDEAQSKAAGI